MVGVDITPVSRVQKSVHMVDEEEGRLLKEEGDSGGGRCCCRGVGFTPVSRVKESTLVVGSTGSDVPLRQSTGIMVVQRMSMCLLGEM